MMLWKRLGLLLPWRRRAAERDMAEELRSIAGMANPGELGNLTLAAEDARAEWGWTRLEQTLQDLRYALRSVKRSPGFTTAAVLSLALGIGANTALFTLVNAVTWRMLPVSHPETLLLLEQREGTRAYSGFTYQQYELIRDHSRVLELAAYARARINIRIDGQPEPTAEGQLVSGGYFSLLGVPPAAGRILGPDDDRVPLGHAVAMISYGYWKRRFALDPAVIGRQVSLSGVPFTIVGITPPEFFGVEVGTSPDLFVPVMMQPAVMPVSENLLANPRLFSTWLRVVARLKPGVSGAQANAALGGLAQEIEWRPRDKFSGGVLNVTLALSPAATGLSDLRDQFSTSLRILMGVVLIVLLIACANTGNLVLARAAARRAEFAVRLALGAGRSRLIRQVLVEGLVLSGLSGVCGIALAYLATHLLVTYVSAGRSPVVLDLAPDTRVLIFTASVSLLTGLLFASVPALRASRLDTTARGRKDLAGARHAVGGLQPGRWLVVTQVALSLVLLIGAGLFVRTLQKLNRPDVGMDRRQLLIVRVEPRGSDQRNPPETLARLDGIYRDLIARVERLPGVESASLAHTAPLTPISFGSRVAAPSGDPVDTRILMIYPKYFATMAMTITRGRDFHDADLRPGAPLVAVANETFVREVFKGREALGPANAVTSSGQRIEIVGIVKDSRYPDFRRAAPPMLYQTFLQTRTGRGQMVLHVRVSDAAGRILPPLREIVQSIDRDVPMFDIRSLADELDAALVRERLVATLSGFFGVIALTLVSVGLYGLMSFTVARRTAEIGVRVALGAAPSTVARMIARQTLTLVLVGIAVGLPIAWILARLSTRQISGMLFETTPTDPLTIAAATGVLILVAIGAGWMPAHRAARIDPTVALRTE
jgi:putative ABC transport system permease protein